MIIGFEFYIKKYIYVQNWTPFLGIKMNLIVKQKWLIQLVGKWLFQKSEGLCIILMLEKIIVTTLPSGGASAHLSPSC